MSKTAGAVAVIVTAHAAVTRRPVSTITTGDVVSDEVVHVTVAGDASTSALHGVTVNCTFP